MHQNIQRSLQPLALLLALLAAFWTIGAEAQAGQTSAQVENGNMYDAVPKPASRHLTLGVLLFPGFEMLDAYGPMEMWGSLKHAPARFWGGEEKRVSARLVTIAKQGDARLSSLRIFALRSVRSPYLRRNSIFSSFVALQFRCARCSVIIITLLSPAAEDSTAGGRSPPSANRSFATARRPAQFFGCGSGKATSPGSACASRTSRSPRR